MTKSSDNVEKKVDDAEPKVETAAKPATDKAQEKQAPQRIEVDDSQVQACYANFCRVNGTPEELIIDLGLNSQPFGTPEKALVVNQRLVINYYTAKRLLGALQLSVQRHESAFGVLETNVQKRVVPAAMRQGAAGQ